MISGYSKYGDWIDLPDHTEVAPNLWFGGLPQEPLPSLFKAVLDLHGSESYTCGPDTARLVCPLYDDDVEPRAEVIGPLAKWVNRFRLNGPVLVHCQAGLNRSGLVTAYALMLEGMPAGEAIALLRARRSPFVLCNRTFERWLRAREHAYVRETQP